MPHFHEAYTLVMLFFFHFMADFVGQDRETAQKKSTHLKFWAKHVLLNYLTFITLGAIFVWDPIRAVLQFCLANALIHGLIDACTWNAAKKIMKPLEPGEHFTDRHGFWITLGFDQFLHAATIIILWAIFLL